MPPSASSRTFISITQPATYSAIPIRKSPPCVSKKDFFMVIVAGIQVIIPNQFTGNCSFCS